MQRERAVMLKPPTGETSPGETLADLREEIDRIDSAMHRLLMERGEIIDRLIHVKAKQGGGSAFRPSREADMMRRLVESHHGLLPLDTVETIWRIIISTFTYVQSNYAVHADVSHGDAVMRDCCRFHFGFTVPFKTHQDIGSVIAAVKASHGDLGLVPVQAGPSAGAWWAELAHPQTPKIIARLPFVERPDHPAGLPLFVVATLPAEATARDVVIVNATTDRWSDDLPAQLAEQSIEILDKSVAGEAVFLMLAGSRQTAASANTALEDRLRKLFHSHGINAHIAEIGSHAARFDLALGRCEAAQ
jgi:chorismate mutase